MSVEEKMENKTVEPKDAKSVISQNDEDEKMKQYVKFKSYLYCDII